MTLALASKFRRSLFNNLPLLVVVATYATVACVVATPSQKIDPAASDGMNAAQRRILPPSMTIEEAKTKKSQGQVENLLADLPQEARGDDSEINIPISILEGAPSHELLNDQQLRRREMRNRRTDNEITGSTKNIEDRYIREVSEIDKELKVAPSEKTGTSPSYVSSLQKIKDLYRQREFENALVETNEALRHFPRSAQLLTMKGTLYQRIQQLDLALASYERAYDIEPSRKLQAQINHLKSNLSERAEIARPRVFLEIPGESLKGSDSAKGVP